MFVGLEGDTRDGLLGFITCLIFNQDSRGYSQLNLMEVYVACLIKPVPYL